MSARIQLPRRRLVLASVAAPALAAAGGCATSSSTSARRAVGPAGSTEPPPLPVARVGQRWRYQLLNRYNGQSLGMRIETVARVQGSQVVVDITDGDGKAIGQERYQGAWQVLVDQGFDIPQTFAMPVPRLPTVLRAGAEETLHTTYRVPNNSSALQWSQWLTARGWEMVSVPAGNFEALRIDRRIRFRHNDLFREFPERTETIWYAPAVERWVRREWTGIYYWPGNPPVRLREDWVEAQLVDYTAAPTS